MATIIEALLVTLGLETKEFDKGNAGVQGGLDKTGKASDAAAKQMADDARKSGLAFAKLRGEVVGLFLAFAGAKTLTGFAANTMNATAQVGRTAQVFGMATNTVNAWGDAIKAAGGDAGEATAAFGKIKDIQANFIRNPGSLNMPLMGQLGIKDRSLFDDPEALMGHLADQYQREKATAKTPEAQSRLQATFRQRVQELLGLSDNWVAMLERGKGPLQDQIRLDEERDRVTVADTEAARQFNESLTHIERSLAGVFRAAGGVTILNDMATVLDYLAGTANQADESTKTLALGLGAHAPHGRPGRHNNACPGRFARYHQPHLGRQRPTGVDDRAAHPWHGRLGNPAGDAGGIPGGTAGGIADAQQKANYNQAVGRFTSKEGGGYSKEAAAGMAAALWAESKLNPHVTNGTGMQGVGQWDGTRRARFRSMFGHDPAAGSLAEQLKFKTWELAHTHRGIGDALHRSGVTAAAAGQMDIMGYEAPQGRFLPSLGRHEHQRDLQGDLGRMRGALAPWAAARAAATPWCSISTRAATMTPKRWGTRLARRSIRRYATATAWPMPIPESVSGRSRPPHGARCPGRAAGERTRGRLCTRDARR